MILIRFQWVDVIGVKQISVQWVRWIQTTGSTRSFSWTLFLIASPWQRAQHSSSHDAKTANRAALRLLSCIARRTPCQSVINQQSLMLAFCRRLTHQISTNIHTYTHTIAPACPSHRPSATSRFSGCSSIHGLNGTKTSSMHRGPEIPSHLSPLSVVEIPN